MTKDHHFDLLPILVYRQEPDYTISYGNQAFTDLFGEPGGRKCYQVFQSQDHPCKECLPGQHIRGSNPFTWDYLLPGGQSFQVHAREVEIKPGSLAFLAAGFDLGGRLQKERSLGLEVERFRTIADFTIDWEYWLGADGRPIYNSPAFERITGRPAGEFLTNPYLLTQITHPEDRALVEQHLKDELTNPEVFSIDFRILTLSGEERWISHACQPVYRSDGEPLGRRASNRDITERKLADQALLRAERLAAIGRLVASLAHEINNPLQAMYSSIELVMDFPLEPEERQKYLGVVRREIERLRQINRNILDFARPRQAVQQDTSLEDVTLRALALASEQLKQAGVEVSVNFGQNLSPIVASHDQLVQVCLNLIINAVEQMPAGGKLSVCARQTLESVEMTFTDNGTGIFCEPIDLIFEPFYTTKKDGTGLGLAVSQNIVQQYGGTLSAHNSPEGGAVFRMAFPVQNTPKKRNSRKLQ